MLNRPNPSDHRQTRAAPLRRPFAVRRWRVWTALLTAIAFAVLVSTAATHHHATAVEDQDCAICSVVAHNLGGLPLVNLPQLAVVLVSYAPYSPAPSGVVLAAPALLPPSCGPPAASPAIG